MDAHEYAPASAGTHRKKIPLASVAAIQKAVEDADVFSRKIPALSCATDNPTVIITVSWDGKSRAVEHDHGCSGDELLERLTRLENRIDELVEIHNWASEKR